MRERPVRLDPLARWRRRAASLEQVVALGLSLGLGFACTPAATSAAPSPAPSDSQPQATQAQAPFVPAAAGSFTLEVESQPAAPSLREAVTLRLSLRNDSAAPLPVPVELGPFVSVSAVSQIVGQRLKTATAARVRSPDAHVATKPLAPGEVLRVELDLGQRVSLCAEGCPAGNHVVSISVNGLQDGDAPRAQVSLNIDTGFVTVAEGLSVKLLSAKRSAADPAQVEIRSELRNELDHALAVPTEGWTLVCNYDRSYRGKSQRSEMGVGGQAPNLEPPEAFTLLAPGASMQLQRSCEVPNQPGRYTLRPRMFRLVQLDTQAEAANTITHIFSGWVELPEAPLN